MLKRRLAVTAVLVMLSSVLVGGTATAAPNGLNKRTIPVTDNPFWVAANPQGGQLYVTQVDGGVRELNPRTNTVVGPAIINGVAFPFAVSYSPDGSRAYISNNVANTIGIVDTSNNQVVDSINTPESPAGTQVSPDGQFLYVVATRMTSGPPGQLVKYRTSDLTPVGLPVDLGAVSQRVVLTNNGTRAYVTNMQGHTVTMVNTSTMQTVGSPITTIPGGAPAGIATTPNSKFVYVANSASNKVSVISTATNKVIKNITVQQGPYGVAINSQGTRVYVTNGESGTVSVINSSNNRVVGTVAVGKTPSGIALLPDGSRAYVANFDSDSVSVFNTTQNPNKCGSTAFPRRIKKRGTTTLLPRTCLTTAGSKVRVKVKVLSRARGEVRAFTLIRGKRGKVSIRTYGKRVNLQVTYTAPARSIFPTWNKVSKFKLK